MRNTQCTVPNMTRIYGWQRFYEEAMLETKSTRLSTLIQAAEAAIDARLEQLGDDRTYSTEERQAIADALSGLQVLKREVFET